MNSLIKNRDWLYNQYIVLKKSPPLIQKEFNLGISTIHRYLDKYNIEKRTASESQKLVKNNNGRFKRGHKKGFTGKTHSKEVKKQISEKQLGPLNHIWKGDEVGYSCLHKWIHRHKKREYFCYICNTYNNFTNFANIDNKYKRKLEDYIEVCVPCHRLLEKLIKKRKYAKN